MADSSSNIPSAFGAAAAYEEGVTLKEHLLAVIEAQRKEFRGVLDEIEKRQQQRYIAQQEAVSTAMIAQEKAVNAAMAAQEKSTSVAMTASERAITKAELAQKEKNESLNELRAMVNDWRSEFARDKEVRIQLSGLESQINMLRTDLSQVKGIKQGGSQIWAAVAAGISILVAIAAVIVAITIKSSTVVVGTHTLP